MDKKFPGAVSGIVSSGGNLGGLLFTSLLLIGDSTEYQLVFYVMGACCLVSVPLAFFVKLMSLMVKRIGAQLEITSAPKRMEATELGEMSILMIRVRQEAKTISQWFALLLGM